MKIKLDFDAGLLRKVCRLYTFLIPFQHFPLVLWIGAAHGLERRPRKEFDGVERPHRIRISLRSQSTSSPSGSSRHVWEERIL